MYSEYPNLYQRARKATFFTQEQAAEMLGLSSESLKQYENGHRIPSDEIVARMVKVYDLPWLALEHTQATDKLGVLPKAEPKSLALASIALTNRLQDATDRIGALLRIAEDGVIDESERPEFDTIVRELRETIAAAYEVIYAAGIKKEHPNVAASECPRLQHSTENNRMNIIAHSPRNASPFPGKGVYSR